MRRGSLFALIAALASVAALAGHILPRAAAAQEAGRISVQTLRCTDERTGENIYQKQGPGELRTWYRLRRSRPYQWTENDCQAPGGFCEIRGDTFVAGGDGFDFTLNFRTGAFTLSAAGRDEDMRGRCVPIQGDPPGA